MFITFLNGLFIGSGRSKLLSRAGKRQQRDMLAAVEPRDLSLTAVTVEPLHRRAGTSVLLAFFDQVMLIGHSRDLRQMRDADDLLGHRELTELFTDTLSGHAGNTGIHLVKDQGTSSRSANTFLSASMMRESSPPEAILLMRPSASPAFAEIKKRTLSAPVL